jgi:RHS repeat-associated protein
MINFCQQYGWSICSEILWSDTPRLPNHNAIPFLIAQNGTIVKVFEKNAQSLWIAFDYSLPLTSNQFSSLWMENTNPNAKGICVGVNGEIHATIFKWKPNTQNALTTFDRSNKILEPVLHSVFHNGNEIVSVGDMGAIIYSPVVSGVPSSNWNLLHHINIKDNLYDVSGNKNGNLVSVGKRGSIIHLYKVGSQMVASTVNSISTDLTDKKFLKVNIHNYITSSPNLGIFLIDHQNQIYNLGFSINTSSYISGSYSSVNSPSITNTLNSIGSVGSTVFIVGNKISGVGQTHQILKFNHTSGGISAIPVSINNVNPLLKICAVPNSNSSVAVGKSGYLIISNDKGISWKNKFTGISSDLTSVNFIDDKNGIAVGKNKAAVYTTDGGKTWHSQSISGANFDFLDVGMGATNRILALIKYETPSPNVSNILQNLNGLSSSSWSPVSGSHPLSGLYNAISFPGPKYAFVAGNNNLVLRLSYNGSGYQASLLENNSNQNWSTALSSGNSNLYSIYYRDYENGFVGGDNGFLMRTRNGGEAAPVFERSTSYCGKKIKVMNGCQNENLHLVQYGSTASDTVVCLKNFEFSTKFYYDGLGRMVASQNTKQMREGKTVYSYTLYDYKGRIVEVGKKVANSSIENAVASINNLSGPVYDRGMVDYNRFEAWILADVSTYPRKEVTRSYYDNLKYSVSLNIGQFAQENLRGRVVSSTYTDILTTNDVDNTSSNDTYLSASHYSYDIHGNVKSLVQENKALSSINSELVAKCIDYEYDLVSGKVNKVTYQKAMPDQFIHKYAYDADNRIIEVETSHDGVIWQKDAKYLYYRHGPLARVELGTQQVQGVDYAYTIQGWLKGVNSTNLKGENDIGKDAYTSSANSNTYFAKDEFGFSLNYFDGDYAATKMPNNTSNYFLGETNGSGLNGSTKNLYNGNIKSMVTTHAKFTLSGVPVANGMAYQYDQLNRIISARNNTNYDGNDNKWLAVGTGTAYESNFTYDANGNLLTLNRKDEAGTLYDDFTYSYSNLISGNIKNTNRLTHVSDAINASAYVGDIENGQVNNNYKYDANGNLISDAQEEIQSIEWNLYGKIKSITRTTSSTKPGLEFLYDPTGNRIAKIVKPSGGSNNDWQYTLYFRDAQGNVLSTYEYQNSNTRQLNTYIYGSSRIGEFNPEGFIECGANFRVSEVDEKEELKAWFQDYLQNVLGCNSDFSNSMRDYIAGEMESDLGISIDQLAQSGDQNYKRFLMNLIALFCRIRLFHDLNEQDFSNSVKPKIKEWLTFANSQTQSWTSFSESVWLDIENNRKQTSNDLYVNCLSGGAFVYDDGTHFYGLGSRKYELSNHLGNVLAVITDKKIPKGENGNFSDLVLLSSQFLTGTEDWEAINSSTLETTNDKLNISGATTGIGAVTSLSLKDNTNYTLNFDLAYSSNPSDIIVTLKDQSQITVYSGNASNASGVNTFAMNLGTFTNPLTLEITNSGSSQTYSIDNLTLTQDGIAGVSYYTTQLVSAQDYYPFGTTLPGRTFQDDRFDGYRFAFNGKEKDNETYGDGNEYDYGFRIYNPRLGKFLSVDPLTQTYPWYTPYQFSGNRPIWAVDRDGLEEWYSTVNLHDPKPALTPTSHGPLSLGYAQIIGLSPIPSVVLPEAGVRPPTLTEDLTNYINSHEFMFEMEGNISFGAQIGLEGELNGRAVGFDANVGSMELLGGKATINGMEGDVSGNYVGKDGMLKVKQVLGGGLGIASAEIEREFDGSYSGDGRMMNDKIKIKGGIGIGPVGANTEMEIPLGTQSGNESNSESGSLYGEIGGKAKLMFGIEVSMKVGVKEKPEAQQKAK